MKKALFTALFVLPLLAAHPAQARISEAALDRIYPHIIDVTPTSSHGLSLNTDYLDPSLLEAANNAGRRDALVFRSVFYSFARTYLTYNHITMFDQLTQEDLIDAWLKIILLMDGDARNPAEAVFERFISILRDYATDPDLIDDLNILRKRLLGLNNDADLVAHHPGVDADERLQLLNSANSQLKELIAAMKSRLTILTDPEMTRLDLITALEDALAEELDLARYAHDDIMRRDRAVIRKVTKEVMEDKGYGEEFLADFNTCLDLEQQRDEAWISLIGETFTYRADLPDASGEGWRWPLVSDNEQWRAYSGLLASYDDCVLSLYSRISNDEGPAIRVLNSFLPFGGPSIREKKRLRHQDRLLYSEAVIRASDQLRAALYWERDYPMRLWLTGYGSNEEIISRIGANIATLRQVWKQSAAGKTPAPVFYAMPLNSAGRANPGYLTWLLGRWIGNDEMTGLAAAGRVLEFYGASYLVPAQYAFRTIDSYEQLGRVRAAPLTKVDFQ